MCTAFMLMNMCPKKAIHKAPNMTDFFRIHGQQSNASERKKESAFGLYTHHFVLHVFCHSFIAQTVEFNWGIYIGSLYSDNTLNNVIVFAHLIVSVLSLSLSPLSLSLIEDYFNETKSQQLIGFGCNQIPNSI